MLLVMRNMSVLFGMCLQGFQGWNLGVVLREFERIIFRSLYLYLWYNHATSISNGWVGGFRLCGLVSARWYWSHNYLSLVSGLAW